MKLCIQTKNIITDNPDEGFEKIRNAGFECCDFSLNNYLTNTDIYEENINRFFDSDIEKLKEYFRPYKDAARKSGVKIHQMHMPYPMYVPKGSTKVNEYLSEQMINKSLEICAFFECKYIVVHGLKMNEYLGSEEAEWQETERFLEKMAPFAIEKGITLCIENLYSGLGNRIVEGPCCDADKAARRIDEFNEKFNAEVLGFCFDTGHANLVGLDNEKFITTLGKRLKVLHIHDNDGRADLHQIPFTFSQTRKNMCSTNWEGFITGLKNIGYDGALNFETGPALSSFPVELKDAAIEMIYKIGKYLSDRIEK